MATQKAIVQGRIVLGAILLVILVAATAWIASGFPRQSVLDAQIDAAREKIEKEYNDTMVLKEQEISKLKQEMVTSQQRYDALMAKYSRLEKEKIDVKMPTTDKELRERFGALGYPVVDCPRARAK
mgnify:CR=1 FL=1